MQLPTRATQAPIGSLLLNFRDISTAVTAGSIALAPKRIYRSAGMTRASKRPEDVAAVLSYLAHTLRVRTLVDLRDEEERRSDALEALIDDVFPPVPKEKTTKSAEHNDSASGSSDAGDNNEGKRRRFMVPLLTTRARVKGMLWEGTDWRAKCRMVASVLSGGTMKNAVTKEAMNPMGLFGLYKTLLVHAGGRIAEALRICTDQSNYPIVFFCDSGKDRTGLVVAVLLRACLASKDDVVRDYRCSGPALQSVTDQMLQEYRAQGLSEEFIQASEQTMLNALNYIDETWGSVHAYLAYAGFSQEEQQQLQTCLRQSNQ